MILTLLSGLPPLLIAFEKSSLIDSRVTAHGGPVSFAFQVYQCLYREFEKGFRSQIDLSALVKGDLRPS
jgi:hypothetical protein